MNTTNPPKFLILTFLAAFVFAFAAGVLFFWPQARASLSETLKAEQTQIQK